MDTAPARSVRILHIDDHPLLRKGFQQALSLEYPGSVLGQAASLEEARVQLMQDWDLVILDQNLPDGRGVEFLAGLVTKPRTLVLSMYEDGALARLAKEAGAKGYASKADSPEKLLEAIATVLAGKESFPVSQTREAKLSDREEEVLGQLLKGKTPTEIAKEFGVRQTTIQSYKTRLFSKLGVDTMADLVRQAVSRGIG